jgi:hypothetical protein
VKEKIHLIIPDQHACPTTSHKRALYVGKLIEDIKPNVVINLGDAADMPSLSSYDKGTKGFEGRRYSKDVEASIEFQDLMWKHVSKPTRDKIRAVVLEGNHEYRIDRATNADAMLDGTISYDDLQMDRYYDDIVRYNGASPGEIEIDGVTYAHFRVSGVMGRPIGGEHPAHSLLVKGHGSTTVGHSHLYNYAMQTKADGSKIMGLVAGCYDDNFHKYAGAANKLWWAGLSVKRGVSKGVYDLESVSLERLKNVYGRRIS